MRQGYSRRRQLCMSANFCTSFVLSLLFDSCERDSVGSLQFTHIIGPRVSKDRWCDKSLCAVVGLLSGGNHIQTHLAVSRHTTYYMLHAT